jgi:aspartyl/asparaginyl beta-hydroxylase (cupin superfamily)
MLNAKAIAKLREILQEARRDGLCSNNLSRFEDLVRQFGEKDERQVPVNQLQSPMYFFKGLSTQPWYNSSSHPKLNSAVQTLENNYSTIRREILEAGSKFSPQTFMQSSNNATTEDNDWRTIQIKSGHRRLPAADALLPKTTKIIYSLPNLGELAFASSLSPKARIEKHCGPWNVRLNVHLGISIPEKCGIRVGSEEHRWHEGECLVFDDSFEHEVWNTSDQARIVLVVNVWHPALSPIEIKLLEQISNTVMEGELPFEA